MIQNRFDFLENNLDIRFESLGIAIDELMLKSLVDVDKFEEILLNKARKSRVKIKCSSEEIHQKEIMSFESLFKNFPFKDANQYLTQFKVGHMILNVAKIHILNF
jgi:hypothetical protein